MILFIRFNVAIKSAIYETVLPDRKTISAFQYNLEQQFTMGLLDEAKTMVTLDRYHENIVNLQGLLLAGEIDSPTRVNMLFIFKV